MGTPAQNTVQRLACLWKLIAKDMGWTKDNKATASNPMSSISTEELEYLRKRVEECEKYIVEISMQIDEHPEYWEGPCLCKLCQSYGD